MTGPETFDLVVVGGGTSGCAIAARASEDRSRRVLLVEDGPDPRPVPDLVADPTRQPELVAGSPYVRRYDVERGDGSTFPLLSGRIMGGGSSVNNLAAIRPMRRDFDDWAGYGGPAWSYDAMLPVMRAIESDPDFPDSPLHGSEGPLRLHRPFRFDEPGDPPVRAWVAASVDAGLPVCDDVNGPEAYGICSSPYNIVRGRRQSSADAYLDAARDRPNLVIRPETTATRLLVEAGRACGVEVISNGQTERILAGGVVLAAGVFHSPLLLLRSGIGPPAELERLGIAVVHPLRGVGANYQDHAVVFLAFRATDEVRDEFVIPKVRLVAKSDEHLDHPDLHVLVRPPVADRAAGRILPVSVHLLDHRSRGRVSLASRDALDLPAVDPALLADPDDVAALVGGIRLVRRLTDHPALAAFYGPLLTPASEDRWEAHVRTTFGSYHHGVGTCRMGGADDDGAVVDSRLRVHGIEGLMVADASVLPTVPRANTNLAAVLVGEVAARELAA